MIERVLEHLRSCDFDVEALACDTDPESDELAARTAGHRLLEALSRTLAPADVLQLDCGYGYVAAAVLHGCESAHLIGLGGDLGEASGALEWARAINPRDRCEFSDGGIEALERFEDRIFDLAILRLKPDGDRSYRELEALVRRARWIVIEGYFDPASKNGFLATNEFLHRFHGDLDEIQWLPGSAPLLLIRPNPRLTAAPLERDFHAARGSSTELKDVYTEDYFRTDCGGYQTFNRNRGRELEDPRLQSVAMIAGLRSPGRALDIGCGRGELSHYLATIGHEVTAVDYSTDAIALARSCFDDGGAARERVEFICGDATEVPLEGSYDLAVASDVIEHLMPHENERLYRRIAEKLGPDGLFVVHTYPNKWYYERAYPRQRAAAAKLGAYLPPQPRSRYEVVVHPNEQDPETLATQLSRHFEDVLVWVGDPLSVGGSLLEAWEHEQWEASPDIFAVASHETIDVERLMQRLRMAPLPAQADEQITLELASPPPSHRAPGSFFHVEVELHNDTHQALVSAGDHALNLSYRWLRATGETLIADGERTRLVPQLEAGERGRYRIGIRAPREAGAHTLRLTLVQEGLAWLDRRAGRAHADVRIAIACEYAATEVELPPRSPAAPPTATPDHSRASRL